MTAAANTSNTVDETEIARFSAIADEWWDPTGKFKPLHKFSPIRLAYIKEKACAHFDRLPHEANAFDGLRLLDIGCGGGLLCEPMARLGAEVIGADPSETNINVARMHAEKMGLSIDYRPVTAGTLAEAGETFDIILNMEVVEHVADVPLFMKECASMLRPGGLMFVATINRTLKAYALAIVGAEKVLKWLPEGTHQYEKLVKPTELEASFNEAGLILEDRCGVSFNPLLDKWRRSKDLDVNYMLLASRPKQSNPL